MPDIAMCPSEKCPSRASCYRSPESGTKPDERRQCWADWDADRGGLDRCMMYEPVRRGADAAQAPS